MMELKGRNMIKKLFIIILLSSLAFVDINAYNIDSCNTDFKYRKQLYIEPLFYIPYYYLYSSSSFSYDERVKLKNHFNYGLGVILSIKIKRLKISSGIAYSTKNYSRTNEITDKIGFYNIPISLTFVCGSISPYLSYVFNRPFFYNNFNNEIATEDAVGSNIYSFTKPSVQFNNSNSFITGLNYSHKLNKSNSIRLNFNIYYEFLNYKTGYIESDIYYSYTVGYGKGSYTGIRPISYNKFKIGLNIGLEINLFCTKH